MTKRDLLSVGLKICGVSFIFNVVLYALLTGLSFYAFMKDRDDFISTLLLGVGGVLFCLLLAIIIIRLSDRITSKLIPVDKEIQVFIANDWQKDILILAIRIIGVVNLFIGITGIFSMVLIRKNWAPLWMNLVCTLFWILISIYFLFGAKHLVKLVFKDKPVSGQGETGGGSGPAPSAPSQDMATHD